MLERLSCQYARRHRSGAPTDRAGVPPMTSTDEKLIKEVAACLPDMEDRNPFAADLITRLASRLEQALAGGGGKDDLSEWLDRHDADVHNEAGEALSPFQRLDGLEAEWTAAARFENTACVKMRDERDALARQLAVMAEALTR